ncbi:MAG: amidohydrolase family protein [Woeseiaceae bacterium]|nr:amidohydrolase family protein [Woeseiaceae bacterium]
MRNVTVVMIALSLTVGCQPAPDDAGGAGARGDLVVHCGALIDGIGDGLRENQRITITAGRIAAIAAIADAPAPDDGDVLDLSQYTCLPGLIDTHVHLASRFEDSGDMAAIYDRSIEETTRIGENNSLVTLAAGFTTVRNVGDYFPSVVLDLKRREQSGELRAPRIQTAGPYLTIPGGGGDLVIPGEDESRIPPEARRGVARGADDFADKARQAIDDGADFIKVIASGAVFAFGGVPGAPEMTPGELGAVVDVARQRGVRVTAHAHGAQSIKDAIRAGVNSIEHASLADDEAIALAAERGVAFSMDVYNGTYTEMVGEELGYPEEFMRKNEETTEAQRIVLEKAYAAGVPILYGTDAAVYPHGINARQFEVMVARGMSPMDAIRSATSLAAEHMGWSGDVGAIEAGRYGDLIAVRGNPLHDIALLQSVDFVIKGGVVEFEPDSETVADAVYRGGRIYTVDDDYPWAEAVAIANGRIVYVGDDDGVADWIGDDTQVYSLNGRMMLPAFQDAHIHTIYSALEVLSCDLSDLGDLPGYRARILECAADGAPGEWLVGSGWSMSVFGPGALASKSILDELVPDRPVYLESADGHSAWVNSLALDIAGVDENTPDPRDGVIDRDPQSGEIVGSLQEGAQYLVRDLLPAATLDERIEAMRFIRDMMHGFGITTVQDAHTLESHLEAMAALDAAGELNLRVVAALWWDRDGTEQQIPAMRELRRRYTSDNVRPTSVKIMQDGVIENYTAAMLEPYLIAGGSKGIPMVDPEFLKDAVTAVDAAGFQVHFHAIGDAATRQALDAIEVAQTSNGQHDLRHHISHLQIIDPADIPRFERLGVVANFQPLWAYADDYVTELTVPFIGEDRAQWMYPVGSVWKTGATVAFGSDWSVSTADPFPQIEVAVTRVDPWNHDTPVMNPEQRITTAQAIEAFTINAAYVNHLDDRTGSIKVGKLADLIVVDQNLLEIQPRRISDTQVLLTLFEGRPVYGDPASL